MWGSPSRAARRSNRFDAASGNAALTATLRGLSEGVTRVKLLTKRYNQSTKTQTAHQNLFNAIENGDANAAERLAKAHVLEFRAIILNQLMQESTW